MTFSKFNLENPWSRSWVRGKLKVTTWVQHSIDSHPFRSMSIRHPIPELRLFLNLTFLENPRSKSWLRSKLKVTKWVLHHIDSHPFCSMSIGPAIPETQHFQNLTLKIQGQGHGWGECWKSHHGCNIPSTHIPFVPCQLDPHTWDTAFSKFDLENPRSRSWVRWTLKVTTWVQHSIDSHTFNSMSIRHPIPEIQLFQNLAMKIQGQGHGWGERWKSQSGCNILSTHIPFVPCQSGIPFLSYDFFKIWPWKSRVKVMGEVTVQSHNVGLASYRLTSLSFHVNWESHTWVMTFSKFDLENQGSTSWVRSQFKVTMWV